MYSRVANPINFSFQSKYRRVYWFIEVYFQVPASERGSYCVFRVLLSLCLLVPVTYWATSYIFSSNRQPEQRKLWTYRVGNGWGSFLPATSPPRWRQIWHLERYFFCRISRWHCEYIFLFFGPVYWKVLDAKALVEIGHSLRDCIDDMGDLVCDYKLNVLNGIDGTLAASWSPTNSPSLIFIGPNKNSMVVCAYLKLGWFWWWFFMGLQSISQ
jgi:hypothetical protein